MAASAPSHCVILALAAALADALADAAFVSAHADLAAAALAAVASAAYGSHWLWLCGGPTNWAVRAEHGVWWQRVLDSPESYGYDVYYRVVPGLTFDMCKGITTEVVDGDTVVKGITTEVLADFVNAIKYLDKERHVYGSTRLAPRTRLASTH